MSTSKIVSIEQIPELTYMGFDISPFVGMVSPLSIGGYRAVVGGKYAHPQKALQSPDASLAAQYVDCCALKYGDTTKKKLYRPNNVIFFGKRAISYDKYGMDLARIDGPDVFKSPTGALFRPGQGGDLNKAVSNLRKYHAIEGTLHYEDYKVLLYKGTDTDSAQWIYTTFLSDMESYDVLDDDGKIDHTVYSIYKISYTIGSRYDDDPTLPYYIDNDELYSDTRGHPSCDFYHSNTNHYKDFWTGETSYKDGVGFSKDLDLRVMKFSLGTSKTGKDMSMYTFEKDADNAQANCTTLKFDVSPSWKILDNKYEAYYVLSKKNPLLYPQDDLDKKYAQYAGKGVGEDDYFYVYAKSEGDSFISVNVEKLNGTMTMDYTKGSKDETWPVVGYAGFFVRVYCFHFGNDVFLAARNPYARSPAPDLFFKVSSFSADTMFRYKIGTDSSECIEKTNDRFCIPGCSDKVYRYGGKLYLAAKMPRTLAPTKKYADEHKDTYTYGSTGNKFDPDCPAMARLKIVEIVEKKGTISSNVDSTVYRYKRSEDNDKIDPDKFFVEALGYVLVEDSTYHPVKRRSFLSECFHVFMAPSKNKDKRKGSIDVGLTFAPPSNPDSLD